MPLIHLKTRRVEYKFEIHGKYSVIQGDSGVGKTTFYDLVEAMFSDARAVQNLSGVKLIPIGRVASLGVLSEYVGAIFVVDEFSSLYKEPEFARYLQESENYFIFINRDEVMLGYLPLPVESIYEMNASGKFHTLNHKFPRQEICLTEIPERIIVEDSKSGYLFFKDMLQESSVKVQTAEGAGNVIKRLEDSVCNGLQNIVLVYDAAGFGAYIGRLLFQIRRLQGNRIALLNWDSFEGYMLASRVYNDAQTLQHVDCKTNSFEQFLTERLRKHIFGYSKSRLSPCLRRTRCLNCVRRADCEYKKYTYEDLLYGGVKCVYEVCAKQEPSIGSASNLFN